MLKMYCGYSGSAGIPTPHKDEKWVRIGTSELTAEVWWVCSDSKCHSRGPTLSISMGKILFCTKHGGCHTADTQAR